MKKVGGILLALWLGISGVAAQNAPNSGGYMVPSSGGGGGSPTGPAGGDLSGSYPNPNVANLSNVTNGSLANGGLVNSSLILGSTSVSLGGTAGTSGTPIAGLYLTSPNLGTPSAITLTNGTGLPISTGLTGTGTGVLTALGVNVGTAGAFVVNGGALGTPSSGTLTSATGLPVSTGISGLGTGVATALGNTAGGSGGFALESALGSYLPLAGGALTGAVTSTSTLTLGGATLGSNTLAVTGLTNLGGNTTVTSGSFGLTGNISGSGIIGTSGIRYRNVGATLTDTSSSGTIATAYTDVWGSNTIAASSSTTVTNYYDSYFKAPTAGTNVTLTNKYALGADTLGVLGNVNVTPASANTELLTLNLGALTANTKAINITGTWNSSGTTFDAPLFMNIANTASAAGSKLFDFQVGSTSFLNMTIGGILQSSANGGTDLVNFQSNAIAFGGNGNYSFVVNENGAYGVGLAANRAIGWSSANASGSIPGTPDSYIYRDGAAQILGFSSANGGGTSPFSLRVYNTSSASNANFRRLDLDTITNANMVTVGADNGGTGLAMGLQFQVAKTTGGGPTLIANFSTAGHLLWNADATYNIGASGANRPENIYAANVIDGAGGFSVNGTAGASCAAGTVISSITVVKGIITAITGTGC